MRDDWTNVTFDSVLRQTKEKHKPEYEESLFYVGLEHIQKSTSLLTGDVGIVLIKTVKNRFSEGQILYGKLRPYLNKVHLAKTSGVCSTDILVFEPSECLNAQFALFFMLSRSFVNDMSANTNGVNLPRVPTKFINAYSFPLAPLPEQRAIVAKIEGLVSDLDQGIADLKTAQDQLKIYRQAVLKKAFEGELTNSKIKTRIDKLGSAIEKPRYGTSKKCSTEPMGIPVLRIPNIGKGIVDPTELKYAKFEDKEISTLALKEGDLLTIRSNGSVDLVGKCALITKHDENYLYAGYLIRIRPKADVLNSKYLLYCLSSHELRIQIENKAKSTSGVNNINSGELQSLEIPIFPIEEQHQIVREIETRLSVCDEVEQSILQGLEKAEALRQSILKKAFEGRLLSDAELAACRAQPDYESAATLLERIQAEREG
ncbi:MAG: restriction endonuclease subunit S [Deltaproteobacteria bacterium]|nr:restriction endonuclease subunit S [Deltaproteobacteria bacterium]